MAVWIKNASGGSKVYLGQTIANAAYYQIQPQELVNWQNDSTLITDIGNSDAVVAKDDSGSNDISDVNEGINYLKGIDSKPYDPDGAEIIRTKAAKAGWTYHMHCIQFESCVLNSLVEYDENNSATSYGTIKFYNSGGTELTTQGDLDSSCVKTVIDYEPTFDYEIIGGKVQNKSVPANPLRLFVVAVPDITYANGGSRVMVNNVDISYLTANSEVNADGRASKYMAYDATYHTNKLRVVMYHSAGEKVKFQMIYEMYRA